MVIDMRMGLQQRIPDITISSVSRETVMPDVEHTAARFQLVEWTSVDLPGSSPIRTATVTRSNAKRRVLGMTIMRLK